MSWPLLLIAVVLVSLGLDGLRLSRGARLPSDRLEGDKQLFGAAPSLPESAREWLRDRYAVRTAAMPLISWLLVLLGLVVGAVGAGWLPAP